MAALAPRPDATACVRKLPEPRAERSVAATDSTRCSWPILTPLVPPAMAHLVPACSAKRQRSNSVPERVDPLQQQAGPTVTARRSTIEPTAPGRYKVQFTADAALREKLERLQELMRDSDAGGDLAAVIEQAVTEKLERLEARRFGTTKRPRVARPKREWVLPVRSPGSSAPARSQPRSGGPCTSVTAAAARTPMPRGDGAAASIVSSTTTARRTVTVANTRSRTSACCAGLTTG